MTEPATVATDVALALLAFVFAVRLASSAAERGSVATGWLAGAMAAAGIAALIGAIAHGADPARHAALRDRCWRGALYATGPVGAATVASVAYFAARGAVRATLLALGAVKLAVYLYRVARWPEFRVAAADYGIALAVLLAGAAYEGFRRGAAGMRWMFAGVLVSLLAGIVQARRLALHRQFNHNDLYHVIQMAALYALYRGGMLLVDR
jgi:hypothetical protein